MKKLTTEEFIKRAKEVHGNKYNYSNSVYKNAKEKICIICSEHGEFYQAPYKHLNGHGCPKCHPLRKKSTNEFILEAKKVHGSKYDYSKVKYTGANKKVTIICPIHGSFEQFANLHLQGKGCKKCYNDKRKLKREEFTSEARKVHGDKYDYSKVDYINSQTKVCIICPEHGEFWQTPNNHLQGKGCQKCNGRFKMNTNEFILEAKKVHGDKYDYSKVEYKKMFDKVCIICPEHGEFWQTPSKHLLGHGCPICKQSNMENEISLILYKNKINFEREKTFSWLKNKKNLFLDFYLPDYNIAIECQGIQHFEPIEYFGGEKTFKEQKLKDLKKKHLCEEHNIKVIYYTNIPEYKKITKSELLANIRDY